MQANQFFDPKLLSKYNTSGPRYTSYPTALEFHDEFSEQDFIQAVKDSPNRELSLYVHIPFCHSLCYYCGCNKVITRHRDKADTYLEFLAEEISSRAEFFTDYTVKQLHWGGGTPSFLTHIQITKLVSLLKEKFTFAEHVEMSIEIDPREIEMNLAEHLFDLGFNRLSIGVQDIDKKVQETINRVQSTEFISDFIAHAKAVGFKSINIDLIYGLPHQTIETFTKTLNKAHEMDVDRISLFSYAHIPNRFAAQRKLRDEWLPSVQEKFALMKLAIEKLCGFGYDFIGMDHFAKPNDELSIAQKEGSLHRNFQGYTTKGGCDLLGLGVSSISNIGTSFSQNIKELQAYYKAIDTRKNAQVKGVSLSTDDVIRGEVIRELMCNLYIDKHQISKKYDIDFAEYFAEDLPLLKTFISDGLVENTADFIKVDQKARLLIRNICMSFDAYMKQHVNQQRFSRVI
ncbi:MULTISPECIES: oxygen-independent coproporphyrinogen III oxidase [unclassified Colwellia]|uniref:oxygen-independent coproporphyrinogen III oxidase n=1 Tax=unclassified Colwellia TaxID=196834 RepID=UPI0015F64882|nr:MULTISPECIES: oxygen-independent coproporphyrinogen III oxidase [unclassified Colwellia]MBA6352568.1 oxygen-independent coproporphyrinogen III oxidase [Colwellia sp. BRX9-1]MBA6355852.1 oxygen-independent coproporphyrinogen III oxidase [Colwellia sp. BRX8-3]MBA6359505.1 oxygen-independent coproporphyrinogen III oxidase [Colwellia sp. BRX8-6]MBA6366106.1 oxygen-independent coproporphyrinogen III oxidase [Colwellia sp. BRX8-5]MBA6376063.1 oxygen-independent coproporphyrinogen III oxidase [Col